MDHNEEMMVSGILVCLLLIYIQSPMSVIVKPPIYSSRLRPSIFAIPREDIISRIFF